MSNSFEIRQVKLRAGRRKLVGVLEFDSDELRNIAAALGPTDAGGREMEQLADLLDTKQEEMDA